MCCLCFAFCTREELAEADELGMVEDVCRPCKAAEVEALRRRREERR